MCTRLALHSPDVKNSLEERYSIKVDRWIGKDEYSSKWNVGYESVVPVLTQGLPGTGHAQAHFLSPMKWGMRRKNLKEGHKEYINFFTSKSASVTDPAGVWQGVRQVGRCAIPCNGYYVIPANVKKKCSYVHAENEGLLFLAGFYEPLPDEDTGYDTAEYGLTILTTERRPPFPRLHQGRSRRDRPVFLTAKDDIDAWLDTSSRKWSGILDVIATNRSNDHIFESTIISFHTVSPNIRSRDALQSAELIQPYASRSPSPMPQKKSRAKGKGKVIDPRQSKILSYLKKLDTPQSTHLDAGPSTLGVQSSTAPPDSLAFPPDRTSSVSTFRQSPIPSSPGETSMRHSHSTQLTSQPISVPASSSSPYEPTASTASASSGGARWAQSQAGPSTPSHPGRISLSGPRPSAEKPKIRKSKPYPVTQRNLNARSDSPEYVPGSSEDDAEYVPGSSEDETELVSSNAAGARTSSRKGKERKRG